MPQLNSRSRRKRAAAAEHSLQGTASAAAWTSSMPRQFGEGKLACTCRLGGSSQWAALPLLWRPRPSKPTLNSNLNLEARIKASYRPSSSVLRRDSESLRGSDREGARRPWGYRDDPDMGSLRGLRLRNCTIQFQHVGMGCRVRLGGLYCRKCVEPRTRSSIFSNILTHSVAKLMAEVETSSGCTNKPRAAHSEGSQDQQCTGVCSGYLRPSSCACM